MHYSTVQYSTPPVLRVLNSIVILRHFSPLFFLIHFFPWLSCAFLSPLFSRSNIRPFCIYPILSFSFDIFLAFLLCSSCSFLVTLSIFVFLPSPVFTHPVTSLSPRSAPGRAATAGNLDRRRNNASCRPQHRIQIGFVLSTSCSESCGAVGTMGRGRDGVEWEEIRIGKEAVCMREQRAAPTRDRVTNCNKTMCTDCTRNAV